MLARLETKIPPPVVAALTLLPMWFIAQASPRLDMSTALRVGVAVAVALVGASFSISGAVSFRRAKTTVNPMRPESASFLVTSGVYRITRNPMYVALMLILVAWAIFLASPAALAGPVAFIVYINRFQIRPEESALRILFGDPYAQYQSRVRRWL